MTNTTGLTEASVTPLNARAGAPPQADQADVAAPVAPAASAQSAADYLQKRVKPQLARYLHTAQRARRWHIATLGTQLFVAAAIPIVNVIHFEQALISSVLAGVAALAHGGEQMFRHHETWLVNRQAANALDDLSLRYEMGIAPFNGPNRHDLLVQEADRIFGQEAAKATALATGPGSSG